VRMPGDFGITALVRAMEDLRMDIDEARHHVLPTHMDLQVEESGLERFVVGVGHCPPGVRPQELPRWPVWVEHRRRLRIGAAALEHDGDAARLRDPRRPVLPVPSTGRTPGPPRAPG
jgi:hypothetical protein